MEFLKVLETYKDSDRLAMITGEKKITYSQLWEHSDKLAAYIKSMCGSDQSPVIVYGHKHPMMLVAFLACVKSGRAYVPIDINVPRNRIENIIDSVSPELILATEEFMPYKNYICVNIVNYKKIFEDKTETNSIISAADYVKEEDVYYIIFTSGSTGNPKGVQITYGALNHFTEWALTLGKGDKKQKCFINQAPFSFDLSVMDLYMCLASESCLFALEKKVQMDYKTLFEQLKKSDANVWVSTPSFVDLCLAEPSFSEGLLPDMELFLFCGEILTNKTTEHLLNRFPRAQIYNTYGPTESTVAVTEVCVDREMNDKYNPLPVGAAKPGTMIKIMDGGRELPEGEKGEIVIIGNTVSKGYFKNEKENQRSFFSYIKDGKPTPAYRTGDKGYFQDGWLFYCGRIDLQVKLHGYRMELEDVEKNLMKVRGIKKAVVVPVSENGKVKYLQAFCIYDKVVENAHKLQKQIKEEMSEFVPDYMIPRKMKFVDEIPITANGKADRKRIQEMYGCLFTMD